MAGERTLKRSGQAGSKGRAPLFPVSKQNLIASSLRTWCTKNRHKQIRNEKVKLQPKVEGLKNSKTNKPQNIIKLVSLNTLLFSFFYVAVLLLEFQDDL
jgi:hypothetical protein